MMIDKTNDAIRNDCIAYAEAFLAEYTKTINDYHTELLISIKQAGISIESYLPLYDKTLGTTVSIAVFFSEGVFWLFFLSPAGTKVKVTDNALTDNKFTADWYEKSPEGVPRKTLVSRLGLQSEEILEDVAVVGGEPFIAFAQEYMATTGSQHGSGYAVRHAKKAVRSLQNDDAQRPQDSFQNNLAPHKLPAELKDSLLSFRKDHPEQTKTAFIMMRFSNTTIHQNIAVEIKRTLLQFGIQGLRADDKEFHSDLYTNILTYIYGCTFGIAVFERIEKDDFNPNVSLEVGYMLGLGKSVCLLKDQTLNALPTDLVGKLYKSFDPHNLNTTIPVALSKWLHDKGFV